MVHLKYDIYCIKRIFESAIGTASRASHLARRLIDGVFKPDAILNCTFSGQAPKAQGEERRKRKYECLDSQARRAIIGNFILNIFLYIIYYNNYVFLFRLQY